MNTERSVIQTQYKGYRFRSRLEARWAVFLDSLPVQWEYEKEGYHLQDGSLYLPDFWLSGLGIWLEIKGEIPHVRNSGSVSSLEMKRAAPSYCSLAYHASAGVLSSHGI